ncbi:MAG: serine hydrolase [Ferruginibacter sp.]
MRIPALSLMEEYGFVNTKVNSKTVGRETNRTQYGWRQTTLKEMAIVFERIYNGELINNSLSKKMIRLPGRNYWDKEALSEIHL